MDFGLARREDREESLRTRAGQQLGTPAYMPLEQFQGRVESIGPRSDVYSLGVILFELLTGRRPYEGNSHEIFVKLLMTSPPAPSSIRQGLDPALDAVCLKAMAKEPEDRFASMRELNQALEDYLKRGGGKRSETAPPSRDSVAPRSQSPPHIPPEIRVPSRAATAPQRIAVSPMEITSPRTGMVLLRIEAGEFMMGSPDSDKDAEGDEKPPHRVRITRPFYLGKYEVTQAEYEAVMGQNPSHFKGKPKNPVESVSWLDAVRFCNQLSEPEGLKPFYEISGETVQVPDWNGTGYRLPTEAEWEYACRAGTRTRFCFGDDGDGLGKFAWFGSDAGGGTHEVGQKRPNAFGLYDMHGNVWEWCGDWYDADYYQESPVDDPRGPSRATYRVIRGGCWGNDPRRVRSAYRGGSTPVNRSYYLGFRVARVQSGS